MPRLLKQTPLARQITIEGTRRVVRQPNRWRNTALLCWISLGLSLGLAMVLVCSGGERMERAIFGFPPFALCVWVVVGGLGKDTTRHAVVDVGSTLLRVDGWQGRWITRRVKRTLPLHDLHMTWKQMGPMADSIWHVSIQAPTDGVALDLCCTEFELIEIRETIRRQERTSRDKLGTAADVPPEIHNVRGHVSEVKVGGDPESGNTIK